MSSAYILLIPVVLFVLGAVLIFVILSGKKKGDNESSSKKKKTRAKSASTLLKEANKRLAQNPEDSEALMVVAENYYTNHNFEKAFTSYNMLIDHCATNKELDEFGITLKYALSALQLNRIQEAYKALMICRGMKQDVFEVDFNLGVLEYKKKQFEKAAALLFKARKQNPEHLECSKYLGKSLFRLSKYKEAALLLRRVIDNDPMDKESIFSLGQCYHKLGQVDHALKLFLHLRPDPVIGPQAALLSGTIHNAKNQHDKAIMDFEIGLKHENLPQKVQLELKYQLAATYILTHNIVRAVALLKEIKQAAGEYRDITELLSKYEELTSNQNLQTYLISQTSDFVALCRRLSASFYPNARIKITDISVRKAEYADILAEISTRKWEDVILFRYMRSTGQTGEFLLRDLYAKTKEVRAGRAFCITAGDFTPEAKQFVEARLIDLIEKPELMKKLNSLTESAAI